MTAAKYKSAFELTKDPISRASYMGCLLWGFGKKIPRYDIITLYMNILKHNSLGPNDAPMSYIIIGRDNGFSPARRQAFI